MRHTAILAVKVACAARARGDATLQAACGASVGAPRHFDGPRKNQPFPYTTTGSFTEVADDELARDGVRVRGRFFGYSDKNESEEISAIFDRFIGLFADQALTVDGFDWIGTNYVKTDEGVIQDEGRIIRLFGLELDFLLSEAAA